MSGQPWFAFFPGDYLSDTLGLSCCEHGVYMLLLAVSWQRGPLPDDMDHLARLAANPPIETLRFILQNYWTRNEIGWINKRLERERQEMLERRERRSAAGQKGNQVRWSDRNAIAMRSDGDRIPQPHSHSQEEKNPPTPQGGCVGVDDGFAEFWEAYPRKVGKPSATRAWKRLKAAEKSAVMQHLAAQPYESRPKDKIPHPSTYLNDRRWEDEEGASISALTPHEMAKRYGRA